MTFRKKSNIYLYCFLVSVFSEVVLLDTSSVISGDLNWTKKIVLADPPDPHNGGVSHLSVCVAMTTV